MSEKTITIKNVQQETVDIDYAECAVPKYSRRGFVTMFLIMLGFTFFSASMWVGQEMAAVYSSECSAIHRSCNTAIQKAVFR